MSKRNYVFFPAWKLSCFFILLSILMVSWTGKVPVFKNGFYRAVMTRTDGNEIVFNFETREVGGKKVLYVINATERMLVDSILLKGDSVFIQMPFFESGFKAAIDKNGNLSGQWIKKFADREQVIPFKAIYGQKDRFTVKAKPLYNISGRWDVSFTGKNQEVTKAIGEFEQTGTKLTGTFLTSTGDYRYLEGVVSGDSLMLSGFDGGHAFLFTGKLSSDRTIVGGNFYSGGTGIESWIAIRNDTIELPDGYAQTVLREGESKLNFTFRDLEGKNVSINDDRFQNKVVVIQILGSWCPNCMDETAFLSDYYNKNKNLGIEVIGLAYERTTDFQKSRSSLQRFLTRFQVNYPVLITGVTVSDPQRTEKTLPQLTQIKAFPTSIFIGKDGKVKKIYSGFNGPGTGAHYQEFQREFDETIRSLLNE